MKPPWAEYPKIQLGSLGWRMGHGETYWYSFKEWFTLLDPSVRAAFSQRWPEPERWEGFYARTVETEEEGELRRHRGRQG